jgi:serine acetyltransferase
MSDFARDFQFCHLRRWPNSTPNVFSALLLLFLSKGLRTMLTYRITHWWISQRGRSRWQRVLEFPLSGMIAALVWLTKISCKNDVIGRSSIEGGVCVSDDGYITLGANSVGEGTVIGPRTTIGMRLMDGGLPTVGRNVLIADNCVIYGALTIGDGATLLPGTVLTRSVPPRVAIQGNPARVISRNFDNRKFRECEHVDWEALAEALGRGG